MSLPRWTIPVLVLGIAVAFAFRSTPEVLGDPLDVEFHRGDKATDEGKRATHRTDSRLRIVLLTRTELR